MHLAGAAKDDDGDLGVAEDGDLLCLLDQPVPPLGVGHLPVVGVLYPLYLYLPSPHILPSLPSLISPSLSLCFNI